MPEHPRDEASTERIEFEFYHRSLRQNWKILVLGALVGAGVGLALAMSRPVLFEGVTTLVAGTASNPGADFATLRPLFQDVKLASDIVEELKLNNEPYRLTPQRFATSRVTVTGGDGTPVQVRVRLEDPALASEASQHLADKAVALHTQIHARRSSMERDLLKKQLDRATERLDVAETALLKFQQHAQVDLLKGEVEGLVDESADLLGLATRIEGERARITAAERQLKRVPRLLTQEMAHAKPLPPAGQTSASGFDSSRGPEQQGHRGRPVEDRSVTPRGPAQQFAGEATILNPVYQTLEADLAAARLRLAGLERRQRELTRVRKGDSDASATLNLYYQRRLQLARLEGDYDVAARVRSELLLKYEQAATSATAVGPQLHRVSETLAAERLSRRGVEASSVGLAIGVLVAGLLVVVRANSRRQ